MTLAEWETNFITKYGRKFALALGYVILGFIVHLAAMWSVAATSDPVRAALFPRLAESFTDVLMTGIVAFSGADALITWKTSKHEPEKAGPGPNRPAPRPSGTVSSTEPT